MNFEDKRVFVSGGNGVIGNALVKKLHSQGAIILVGDLKPRPKKWPRTIIYRQGDLNYITKEELNNFRPEYFFHLAATFERSKETYDFWHDNFRHNVHLSNHLMDMLKDSRELKKVIFASSYLIYDPKLYMFDKPVLNPYQLKENDPIYPRNLTGVAKLNHEIELRFLDEFKHGQYQVVSARIYRSYGKYSRDVISRWIRSLLKDEEIKVYAKEGMFDYIYAGDVAEGLIRLALSKEATGVFNLGSGNARRIGEVVSILKKYFPAMKMMENVSDTRYEASQADMGYFKKVIGWSPQIQLEEAIPTIIDYEKNGKPLNCEQKDFNVLITSISDKVPMIHAVKRAVDKIGADIRIFGADSDSECCGRYFVDGFWNMPRTEHLTKDQLINFCRENNIMAVIPSRDGELSFFAKYRVPLAEAGINVMISDLDMVEICIDKLFFYRHLSDKGFPVIFTSEDVNDIISEKVVVKERFGAGSKKIALGVSKDKAIEYSANLKKAVYQPYIQGCEASVDLYLDKYGRAKGVIARKRDIVIDGESQITSTFRNEKLEKLCVEMAQTLELYGHVIFQVIVDGKGEFHVVECNSRFGGASTLSLEMGLDSFYWFLLETLGEEIGDYPFLRTSIEKTQIRHAADKII